MNTFCNNRLWWFIQRQTALHGSNVWQSVASYKISDMWNAVTITWHQN